MIFYHCCAFQNHIGTRLPQTMLTLTGIIYSDALRHYLSPKFIRRSIALNGTCTGSGTANDSTANAPPLPSPPPPPLTPPPPQTVSVLMSQSHNVFANLALEAWLFQHRQQHQQHQQQPLLLLWRNRPCVVLGRHQNPWQEVATHLLTDSRRGGDSGGGGVAVARRHSGGGCVYHDLGNLNMTFFSCRRQHRRRANLQLIADTLRRNWALDVSVNERDDLLLDSRYKISGTAAKLARDSAYHHCTLMVNVDLAALRSSLQTQPSGLQSGATASVPAAAGVANIGSSSNNNSQQQQQEEQLPRRLPSSVSVETVAAAVGHAYLAQFGAASNCGFHLVNPSDDWFPGLSLLQQQLSAASWVYGHTPRFSHTVCLSVCHDVRVRVHVERAKVVTVELLPPDRGTEVCAEQWVRSLLPAASPEQLQSLVGSDYDTTIGQRVESLLLGTSSHR